MNDDKNTISEANEKIEVEPSNSAEELNASTQQQVKLAMLQDAFESLNQGFNIFDQNLCLVAWNTRCLELLDLPDGFAVIGKPLADIFRYNAERGNYGPGDIDGLVEERIARARQFKPHRFERLFPSGEVIEIVGNLLPGGGFITTYSNITERKNSEAKRLESEERFRDLAELGADWFWEQDKDLRFVYLSKHIDQASARRRDEILGMTRWETVGIDPDSNVYWSNHRDDLLARRPFKDFQFKYHRKDGEVFYRSVSGKPLFGQDGTFMGYRGVASDITQRKSLEEQVRRSQKMDAVGQLTGGIAHDFNNILGIVLGNLEIIESLPPGDSRISERLRKAKKTVERGADITRKLLGFSRKDAHVVQTADINRSVQNLRSLIAKSLTVSIEIKTPLDGNLWTVEIDPGDFDDAILNLALNARDAMPGGGALTIATTNMVLDEKFVQQNQDATAADYVRVSIGDTGTGMTEDVKDKVFDPFFTTKELGKGTGLGLSMVYGFVERSGGFITVDSKIGAGTTFHLYFPRTVKLEIELKGTTNTESGLPGGTEKILIVDDEEGLREIAALNLDELGYRTFAAEDGLSALTILEQEGDIDLLFTDVVMPNKMDAFELAQRVHKRYPDLKILLTSGYTGTRAKLTATFDEFITRLNQEVLDKPYSISEMAIAVRKILDEK
ncbi:MAG: PAS-domain containing protein [Sneathiella sp.]|nr:PAS-domain containing protein [Sneathiella sp.]